jgi:hypothetical protein
MVYSRMTSGLRAGLAAVVVLAASGAVASPLAVVELFTSQACSSCPPADAALRDLARRTDVIALTMPVDYWDYLGWRDTLAKPAFTARQRAYAATRGDRQVFTPQVVVNGKGACIGSDAAALEQLIQAGRPGPDVAVALSESAGRVAVDIAGATNGAPRGHTGEVWVVSVAKAREVAIERGENRGKSITYANVARGITRIGEWRGAPLRLEVPLATAKGDGDGYVVLLQAPDGGKLGPILGAAKSPGL